MSSLFSRLVRRLRLVGVRAMQKKEAQTSGLVCMNPTVSVCSSIDSPLQEMAFGFSGFPERQPQNATTGGQGQGPIEKARVSTGLALTFPLVSFLRGLIGGLSSPEGSTVYLEPLPASNVAFAEANIRRNLIHAPARVYNHHRPARARRQGTFVLERSEKRQTIKTGSFAWAL